MSYPFDFLLFFVACTSIGSQLFHWTTKSDIIGLSALLGAAVGLLIALLVTIVAWVYIFWRK